MPPYDHAATRSGNSRSRRRIRRNFKIYSRIWQRSRVNVQVSGGSKRSQVEVSGSGSREEKEKHKTREAKSKHKTDEATKSMKN